MKALIKKEENLPSTIEELRDYILIGKEKLKAYQVKVGIIDSLGLAKDVRDKAIEDGQNMGSALLFSEARLGELLKDRQTRVRTSRGGSSKPLPEGISHKQSHYAQALAGNKAAIKEVIEEAKENEDIPTRTQVLQRIKNKEREEKLRQNDAKQSAGNGKGCTTKDLNILIKSGMKFGTVYADPPWNYQNQSTRSATSKHYQTLTVDEIAALPIEQLTEDNAHLHLWTTNAYLFDAKTIIESWGFTYKSCFLWVKPTIGIGNYWRVSHEFLLLGVKGSLTFADKSQRSWAEYKRGSHSAKPDAVRQLIEKVSPYKYLELFGRKAAPNWVVWGNEIKKDLFTANYEQLI